MAKGAVLRLVAVVTFEVTAVVALHRLGELPWLRLPVDATALRAAPVEDVLAAGVRLAALGYAWWLLAGTALYVIARLSRIPAALRAATLLTPAIVRRAADRAVAVALVSTTLAGGAAPAMAAWQPAVAATAPANPTAGTSARDPAAAPSENADLAAGLGVQVADDDAGGLVAPPEATGRSALPEAVSVAAGDNLWALAAAWLGADSGRAAADIPDAEIAPYWREVVAANRQRIRSADPDLIYPGERLDVPRPAGPAAASVSSTPATPAGPPSTPSAGQQAPPAPPSVTAPPTAGQQEPPPLPPPFGPP